MKLLIFTYAPAGLGHLRVTEALVGSRPKNSPYILLGSSDRFMRWVHRFTSINPVGKFIFLKIQYGYLEDIFTKIYRGFLVLFSGSIYKQFKDIIQRSLGNDNVWIIATHFGLAHQIGAVKDRLIRETGRGVRLIVQVTDDTPQHIWCVRGADLTFVPSHLVEGKLHTYAKSQGFDLATEVIPYPISVALTETLSRSKDSRYTALADQTKVVRVAIPISGAAVGLGYMSTLIRKMSLLSRRFEFWILVKKSPFTEMFRSSIGKLPGVNLLVGQDDTEMVSLYDQLYRERLIHLEVTKPSEQAFKAILSPDVVGGSILLLVNPVGRQEVDNLKFLARHGLLMSEKTGPSSRAIKLPASPGRAAEMIVRSLESGLLASLARPRLRFSQESWDLGEIGPAGARQFWTKSAKKLGK